MDCVGQRAGLSERSGGTYAGHVDGAVEVSDGFLGTHDGTAGVLGAPVDAQGSVQLICVGTVGQRQGGGGLSSLLHVASDGVRQGHGQVDERGQVLDPGTQTRQGWRLPAGSRPGQGHSGPSGLGRP